MSGTGSILVPLVFEVVHRLLLQQVFRILFETSTRCSGY